MRKLDLLLRKDLVACWRSPIITIFTVLLPLALIILATRSFSLGMAAMKKVNFNLVPQKFSQHAFIVDGSQEDFSKELIGLNGTIEDAYCSQNRMIELGLFFSSNIDEATASSIVLLLGNRYPNISFIVYSGLARLQEVLRKDATENTDCMQGVFWGAVAFTKMDLSNLELRYEISMTAPRGRDSRWYVGSEEWRGRTGMGKGPNAIGSSPDEVDYWLSGFLSLQYAVDSSFIEKASRSEGLGNISLTLERLPDPSVYATDWESVSPFIITTWLIMSFFVVSDTSQRIAAEKRSGMAGFLSLMGLPSSTYYMSHAILAYVKLLILFLPGVVILAYYWWDEVSMILMVLLSLAFLLCITCYALLLSSILHSPSLSTYLAGFIWGVMTYLSFSEGTWWFYFGGPDVTTFELLWSWNVIYIYQKVLKVMSGGMRRDKYFGFLNVFDSKMGTYLYGVGLLFLLLHCGLTILLIAYFDNVYPYGDLPRKHPLFFLGIGREKYEKDDKKSKSDKAREKNENVQAEPKLEDPEEVDIDVRNLVKKFGSFRAVNGLSFRARKGRVTALLGHNGAGKSTTFGILCGLSRPTSGSVRICGVRLNSSTAAECQSHIGYCPQYDPYFDGFTVKEHVKFFRLLCDNSDASGEDNVLDWLDLRDSANVRAKRLSGGIRRRLTVAIAIVSGRRILLLDEPTAGLDPGMRQRVNSFIEQLKDVRTILLTTHYMSEADSLGDRINIMVAGKLACAGTSEFLKKRFGAGYLLTVASKESSSLSGEQLIDFIRSYIDDSTLETVTLHQFVVLLPDGKKAKFANLFAGLEAKSDQFGIDSFGISLNSLEQIFFKVGKDVHGDADDIDQKSKKKKGFADGICKFGEEPPAGRLWSLQLRALLRKRLLCTLKKWPRLILQLVFPILLMLLIRGSKEVATREDVVTLGTGLLSPSVVFLQSIGQTSPLYENLSHVLKGAGLYTIKHVEKYVDIRDAIIDAPGTLFPFGLGFVVDSRPDGTSVRAFFSGKSYHGSSVALSIVTNAILGDRSNAIVPSLYPYYAAGAVDVQQAIHLAFQSQLLPAIITLAFALIFAGFVMLPVEERTSRFMHLQLTTGLNPLFYWLSMVIVDLCVFVVLCTVFMIMFIARGALSGMRLRMLLLWILAFFSSTPFVYCFSLLFKDASSASTMVIVVYLFASMTAFAISIISAISKGLGDLIHNVALLFPGYALSDGVQKIVSGKDLFSFQGLLRPLCMLLSSGCVYWLCLTLRYSLHSRRCAYLTWKKVRCCVTKVLLCGCCCPEKTIEKDEDVKQERARVDELEDADAAICLRDLNKYYGGKHAVRDLTFAMDYNECLGLVGVNGVGKTSMFHMLTRITIPDSGKASCGGVSIRKRKPICFCPQYDALLGYLNGKNILTLMAALRGFDNISERVESVLEAVSLVPHARKAVSRLSGGQRRRLSIAAALMVGSREVLLDEPTAGIDPQARREVWALLSSVRGQRVAILLSSHSMDECEALCSRIAIMNEGTIIAIGTTQHIKSKYGKGYILTATITEVSKMDDCVKAVAMKFPAAKLNTDHPSVQLEWQLEKSDDDRLSVLFGAVHNFFSGRLEVTDYSLTQTSLEAAFLKLAQQPDDGAV